MKQEVVFAQLAFASLISLRVHLNASTQINKLKKNSIYFF